MRAVVAFLVVCACSKSGPVDPCKEIVDKMRPFIVERAKGAGRTATDADFDRMTADCRERPKDDPNDKCFLAAGDEAAARTCFEAASRTARNSDSARTLATEARLQLKKLALNAKVFYITNASFPVGKAGPTPEQPCCATADHRCPVTNVWASTSAWATLDFQIDEPNRFQYTYEGTAEAFTATATGDVLCDGHSVTYQVEGSAPNGDPTYKLTEPPAP